MTLTFTEQTFDTKTVNTYDIGSDELVLEDYLDSRDQDIIEAAANGDGLASTQMPNGQGTVYEYYSVFAASSAELTSRYQRQRINQNTTTTIVDQEADVDTITSTYNTHTHDSGAVGAPDQTI